MFKINLKRCAAFNKIHWCYVFPIPGIPLSPFKVFWPLCKDRKKHLQKRADVLFCLIDIYIRVQSLFAWATWTLGIEIVSVAFLVAIYDNFVQMQLFQLSGQNKKQKKKIGKSGSLGDCWLWNATQQQQIAKEQHVHACRVNERGSLKRFSLKYHCIVWNKK